MRIWHKGKYLHMGTWFTKEEAAVANRAAHLDYKYLKAPGKTKVQKIVSSAKKAANKAV